ncbi:MAG: HdeD family acid-resistance protein [Xanthomonadaceae bacterium]|nr:HdeD family acid-resistance protein [Xanthomonadaceae bacterium]
MKNLLDESVPSAVKYWWVSLLFGLIFIATGVWVAITPISSYITLSIFFSVVIFAAGFLEIFYAVANENALPGWGWQLASGIIDVLIGGVLITYPDLSLIALPFIIGFWLMFSGGIAIGVSFEIKSLGAKSWEWLFLLGIVTIILSFFLIINPVFGGISIVYMTSSGFIVLGFFRLILSFKLKKLGKEIKPEV